MENNKRAMTTSLNNFLLVFFFGFRSLCFGSFRSLGCVCGGNVVGFVVLLIYLFSRMDGSKLHGGACHDVTFTTVGLRLGVERSAQYFVC